MNNSAAPLSRRLDAVLDQALAEKRIVGATLLVARQGETAYARAAGMADREAGAPLALEAVFRLASLTKPIVSAAAMALVERGTLSLDSPVTRWLPAFQPRLPDGSRPEITVHHLLTHTAGLDYRFRQTPDGPYHQLNVSDGLDQPGLGLEENLARIAQAPLLSPPGAGFVYSVALDVLGAAMARAADKPLPDLVKETVTGPLGMASTVFTAAPGAQLVTPYYDSQPEPARMGERQAVPLWEGAVAFAPGRAFDAASFPSGGGGMIGSAPDFLRFLEAIRTGGGPILKPESVARMMALQVGAEAQVQGPGWGFGYGWSVLGDPAAAGSPQSKGAIQWGGVYGHNWFVDPAAGLSVALLTNTAYEGMIGALTVQVRDAIYAADAA